ncbi:MAG: DUF447 family protein [Methanobrevibacter sp.]|jgi:hypothetical protein|nr:DUF447 family protein [Candidatus Methanovirga aequatorialis]
MLNVDLNDVNMKKGQHYETIITTSNGNNEDNAAPIGIVVKSIDEITCRVFEGSKTLKNMMVNKKFIVNITRDPLYFTLSTVDNIADEYFQFHKNDGNCPYLKDTESYLVCEVIDIKNIIKINDPIKQSEAGFIKAKVREIVKLSKCVNPINRGIYSLLESLVNYTRIDIVDEDMQDYFLNRLRESERIINKVGSSEEKKAILILKKKLKEKGYGVYTN